MVLELSIYIYIFFFLENITLLGMRVIHNMSNWALVDGRIVKIDIISVSMAVPAY